VEIMANDITTLGTCDQCRVTAYVKAIGPAGGELWFCAHHFRNNEVALLIDGWTFIDQRDQLTGDELREKSEGPFKLDDFKMPPVPFHGRHEAGPGYTAEQQDGHGDGGI
jgi:hypothetical protein